MLIKCAALTNKNKGISIVVVAVVAASVADYYIQPYFFLSFSLSRVRVLYSSPETHFNRKECAMESHGWVKNK